MSSLSITGDPVKTGRLFLLDEAVIYFCPACFREIGNGSKICPYCGTDIVHWENETTYVDKLIFGLRHPVSEVRMAAILALGLGGWEEGAIPLAKCALRWPMDRVLADVVLESLEKIDPTPQRVSALHLLLSHPSRAIRKRIEKLLGQ